MEDNRPDITRDIHPAYDTPESDVNVLEREIGALEHRLTEAERALNTFQTQIRAHLHLEIRRVNELTELYKQQKRDKKARRLEQKKRGKNYKEPKGVITTRPVDGTPSRDADEQQELKRLYKEAIVHVHPDKFATDEEHVGQQANALTVQLNAIYQSGDLQELKDFHQHILSGNAMAHIPYQPTIIADPVALSTYLRKKRDELANQLAYIKQLQLYTVLQTYPDPLTFIDELRGDFIQRIQQLQKRTRTK